MKDAIIKYLDQLGFKNNTFKYVKVEFTERSFDLVMTVKYKDDLNRYCTQTEIDYGEENVFANPLIRLISRYAKGLISNESVKHYLQKHSR